MSDPILLLVEDDAALREALTDTLEGESIQALAVDSGEAALRTLAVQPVDLVCSDVNMPGMNGMQLLAAIQKDYPALPVVLMTAYASIEHSVQALQLGAVDYLVKPFPADVLLETVGKYLNHGGRTPDYEHPVAEAHGSRQLLQMARRVATSDVTVLITGESGTGKEVLARYIHQQSSRHVGPFVAINCAAIPENMLEATLFGYEKGAFTGAIASREGKFEQAHGGTILLDEISEMDAGLQAKLLRVLQEREVERLGGKRTIELDVRVVATSNRDLKRCVAEATFREDLYYRLNVVPLMWLPLRERREDIIPIARKLIASHCRKMGRPLARLDSSAEAALWGHEWPGNVRELDNTVQRALVLQDSDVITGSSLCLDNEILGGAAFYSGAGGDDGAARPADDNQAKALDDPGLLDSDLKQREYQVILNTLKKHRGKRKQTAAVLAISARTLRYKIARMREIGIDIDAILEA